MRVAVELQPLVPCAVRLIVEAVLYCLVILLAEFTVLSKATAPPPVVRVNSLALPLSVIPNCNALLKSILPPVTPVVEVSNVCADVP